MDILDVSKSTDARLAEVRKLLAHIKRLEFAAANDHDPVSGETAAILRGMFFVHLYGALEYAVSLSVQVLLQEITRLAISYSHFQHLVFAVALDPEFKSIVDAGWNSKLEKRRLLLQKQLSAGTCALNDTVFHDQLQNVGPIHWIKSSNIYASPQTASQRYGCVAMWMKLLHTAMRLRTVGQAPLSWAD